MKRQQNPRGYLKVDEIDQYALRLAAEIRKAMAVSGHDPRLLPKLQRLQKTVESAHINLHQALGRRNQTLAGREAKKLLAAKDQLAQLMRGPNRLTIDLDLDF